MFMAFEMTVFTKSYTIVNIVSQVWIGSKGFDMMRMKFYLSTTTLIEFVAAILASVVITLKNCGPPLLIFDRSSGESILMGFADIARPSFHLALLESFWRSGVGKLQTTGRTIFSHTCLFIVFWHVTLAHRALNFCAIAGRANKLYSVNLFEPQFTYPASYTYPSCGCFPASCASHTSGVFRLFAHSSDRWGWRSAVWAWLTAFGLTAFTNIKIGPVTADDTKILKFSHIAPLKRKTLRRPGGAVVEAATRKAFRGFKLIIANIGLNKKSALTGTCYLDTDIIAQVFGISKFQRYADHTGHQPQLLSNGNGG